VALATMPSHTCLSKFGIAVARKELEKKDKDLF